MRISDWSSDVCSSDLREGAGADHGIAAVLPFTDDPGGNRGRIVLDVHAARWRCTPIRMMDQGIVAEASLRGDSCHQGREPGGRLDGSKRAGVWVRFRNAGGQSHPESLRPESFAPHPGPTRPDSL